MNETQKNIKRYRAALPGLRERIVASAMLLLVSLSMVVSASFAWFTLSSAPEVSMLATTVAANGNLEIALADGLVKDGQVEPDEVAIGDSSATQGQSILIANTTWGNLVNLSNKAYGLGEISLRPALLSDYNLSRTPLYGATYSSDGRVEDISEYYRYTSYAKVGNNFDFSGKAEDLKYGVRAISSVQAKADSANAVLGDMYSIATEEFKKTIDAYNGIIQGSTLAFGADTPNDKSDDVTCMEALTQLLEKFVNEQASKVLADKGIGTYSPADYKSVVPGMYQLLLQYQEVLNHEGEVLLQLANMRIYTNTGSNESFYKSVADLRKATAAELKAFGITDATMQSLKTHKADCEDLAQAILDMEALVTLANAGTKIFWDSEDANGNPQPSISGPVSELVDISQTYVGPSADSLTKISSLGATAAINMLSATPIHVEIRGGVLKNTEQRIGALLLENDDALIPLGTRVYVYLDVPIYGGNKEAAVRTNASNLNGQYKLIADMNAAAVLQPEPTDITKKDTYGFAIDFWVRTNGDNTILTLEGTPEYRQMQATCTNINGDITDVYVATKVVELEQEGTEDSGAATIGETGTESGGGTNLDDLFGDATPTETITIDVYKLDQTVIEEDENGEEVTVTYHYVYDVNTHVILGTVESMEEEGYNLDEKKKIKVVSGYQGENRVWMDWEQMIEDGFLEENNTTQGAGSSYIFYADPSDQDRILDMLSYFSIAFLDINDNHLATAKLNVEEAYAINGKVTVPLVVIKGPEYVDTVTIYDADGNPIKEEEVDKRGILALTRGTPTWLTAIVYVDGEEIGNENVLEAGVVEGRLNLQFGSADPITGAPDLPLQQKYRTITASATNGSKTSSRTDDPITYSFDGTDKTVTVNLTVEGDQPTNITGFFTRLIGKNHGTKMESVDFKCTQPGDNMSIWSADFTLTNPGEYVFLSALVDGAEYEFESEVDADGNVIWMAPAVKISGREILRVDCDPAGGVYYTSDESMEITVDASVAAAPDLAPKQVRALFSTGDGKEFTVILGNTGNGDTASYWAGTGRITQGGTYTLEYLVVDGDKSEVTEEQKKDNTFVVKLGIEAQVECVSIEALKKDGTKAEVNSHSFEFGANDESFALAMKVKLIDNQDNELRSQSGVELQYTMVGGSEKMRTGLKWTNEDGGYYYGNLPMTKAGIYQYEKLTIQGSNPITDAPGAPVFTAIPPDPPEWNPVTHTDTFQYAPNGGAALTAYFDKASSATAYAYVKNVHTGQGEWVKGTQTQEDDGGFVFTIPTNSGSTNGIGAYVENCKDKQDGLWRIDEVRLQDVFGPDQTLYESNKFDADGNPIGLSFDVSSANIQKEVLQSIFIDVLDSANKEHKGAVFGKDTNGNTVGSFMQSYEVTGVKIKINKWNGQKVDGIDVDGFTVDHVKTTTKDRGGYTIDSTNVDTDPDWSLSTSDNSTYTAGTLTLPYAGDYNVTLYYSVTASEKDATAYTSQVLTYTVYTNPPTATITGISSTASNPTRLSYTLSSGKPNFKLEDSKASAFDSVANTATIYAIATADNETQAHGSFEVPSMTVTIAGVDSGCSVSFVLPGGANGNDAVTFSRTGNGTITKSLGRLRQIKTWQTKWMWVVTLTHTLDAYDGHNTANGAAVIREMTVVRNGVTYTVTLPTPMTVNNPSSVNQ